MKEGTVLKFKILLMLFLACSTLFANELNFILKHDGLIDQRAQDKINEIGLEAKQKLDVELYVYMIENNGIRLSLKREDRIKLMREFEKNITNSIKAKDFAVLVLSIDQQYASILLSNSLKSILDKDTILDDYVIPLLASKDKNTLFAKTSAATLNGYAQMADSIAEDKNIELKSSMGSGNKTMTSIWKVFMYSVVLFGIIAYTIIVLRERKVKKNGN